MAYLDPRTLQEAGGGLHDVSGVGGVVVVVLLVVVGLDHAQPVAQNLLVEVEHRSSVELEEGLHAEV